MLPRRLARLLAALPVAAAVAAPGLTAPSTAHATVYIPAMAAGWPQTTGVGSIVPDGVNQPYSSPAVGRLKGPSAEVEIVTGALDGWVRVFHANGALDWQRNTGGAIQSSPTLASLHDDGTLDVIVTSRNGYINAYDPNGNQLGGWPQFPSGIGNWAARTGFQTGFMSSAAVGSLFGDGLQDVVASSLDHRLYAWDANGTLLPGFPINLWDTVLDTPLLVDLEGRGQRDIVIGSDSNGGSSEPYPSGGVWWAFRPDGSRIWVRLQDEVPWSSPSAAILNPGDIQPSIVAGTGHYFNQTASASRGNYINVYNANGSDRFGHPLGTPKPNYASPALGDILNRNDGSREIVQVSEDTGVSAWDGNGTLLWHAGNVNGDQLGSPTIAPLGGGACGGGNGVWVPGSHIVGYCAGGQSPAVDITTPGASYGAPLVADLGNGHLSLVAIYQNSPGSTNLTLGVWNLSQTSTMPAGAWPAFHGSMQRTGMPAIVPDARNATFVKNLYHDVLRRTTAPSPSEVAYWRGRLDNGAYRSWVAMALVGSSEAHGFTVDHDYSVMLGRTPDPSGRAFWVSQLDAGVYNEHLLGLLGGSDEYFRVRGNNDFATLVTSLYRDVLTRTSNPVAPAQDIGYWVGRLQTGMSHAVIGDVFANSHEYHLNVVGTWYWQYLGRGPDLNGQIFWANFLDAGHRDDVGIVQLVASDEYFNHGSFFP